MISRLQRLPRVNQLTSLSAALEQTLHPEVVSILHKFPPWCFERTIKLCIIVIRCAVWEVQKFKKAKCWAKVAFSLHLLRKGTCFLRLNKEFSLNRLDFDVMFGCSFLKHHKERMKLNWEVLKGSISTFSMWVTPIFSFLITVHGWIFLFLTC